MKKIVQKSQKPYSCGSPEVLISENLRNHAADFLGNTRSLEQEYDNVYYIPERVLWAVRCSLTIPIVRCSDSCDFAVVCSTVYVTF